MIEPLVARLVSCCVFAGLIGAMIYAVATPGAATKGDQVAAAELQRRVTTSLFTRP